MPEKENKAASDKEIRYNVLAKKYDISVNSGYYKGFFVFFFVMGIILGGAAIPLVLTNPMLGFILMAVLSVPFFLFGLRSYYLSTLRDQGIVIDLQQKVIVYSSSLVIPFKTIKHLSLEETVLFSPKIIFIKKVKAVQVSIEDHRGNKAAMLRTELVPKTKKILREVSIALNVPVRPGIDSFS